MPPSATSRAKTRLSTMTTSVSSTVISRPARSGPKLASATSRLKSCMVKARPGRAYAPAGLRSGIELVEHEVAVAQPIFLQDVADMAVGAHLGQSLGVGRAQGAVLLAHGEAGHAVAAAIDDVGRRRDAPERLEIVVRVGLVELVIDEIVLEHGLEPALVQALQLVDLGLERRRFDADLLEIGIGRRARD